jgi:uncharacterized membrane protein
MRTFLSPRAFLACAIVVMVAGTEMALFSLPVPQPIRDILQVIVGILISKFGTVYDYYFGSSKAEAQT